MFTVKEIKAIKYLLDSRETEYPKEPEQITEALSSAEEKLNSLLKTFKVILVSKASGLNYSIESGLHDGVKNFDHHGEYEKELSPCINTNIPTIENGNGTIEISHIDCDTWVGLLRMISPSMIPKDLNLSLIASLDLNGTSLYLGQIKKCPEIKQKIFPTLCYFVGVGELAKSLNFPCVTGEAQDVTQIITAMRETNEDKIIELGQVALKRSEKSYTACAKAVYAINSAYENNTDVKAGYWIIGPNDYFDPSRPYMDGVDIVVVYRKHWRTVSIYCNPKSEHEFAGKEIVGILFQGHPKACGSPRGKEMTEKDGRKVFDFIINNY